MVIATGESCLLVKIIAKTCVSLTDKQTNEQKSRLGRYYCKKRGTSLYMTNGILK